MNGSVMYAIVYGFVLGICEILPVSGAAHGYLLNYMTRFDTRQPLMLLLCHLVTLLALLLSMRHRISHIRRELRIASIPAKQRKRQPDLMAVLDGRVVIATCIPMAVGVILTNQAYQTFSSLPMIAAMLVISGVLIYIPHYLRQGNRDSRHYSRKDSIILGLCGGLSAIPGMSRTGGMLSAGSIRGFDKQYILDVVLLSCVPALAILIALDAVALLSAGIAVITTAMLLNSLAAAAAAFLGAWFSILIMRFLSVNTGYLGFAYYSWGLGLFSFVLYLMV